MKPISISESDKITFRDFNEGNSVQVRVSVPESEVKTYAKGTSVKIVYEGQEAAARIVSEPLVVSGTTGPGERLLSLIVEKA
ncbi:hypothetical protein KK062_08155 [Fulvivirgaceae bacterium PWU5]|uniref:Uncharacterized protein n=1 Tax=Dawidia cretensis TaxID=2782350 RepID=A0AAP2GUZ1_9BACT|nr:hypothetical protein [Dawidia cretensis]MBT1708192.1 hypothetical protein [Dawidia cretensis]